MTIKSESYDHMYNDQTGQYEDYLSRKLVATYKGSATVTFNYSDDIEISFPSFSTYKKLDDYYKPENIVNRINNMSGNNRLEMWEVNYWTKYTYCTEVREEDKYTVKYYFDVKSFREVIDILNNGGTINVIEVTFDPNSYLAEEAKLITQQGTFKGDFAEICSVIENSYRYIEWTLEEVILLLGEPYYVEDYGYEKCVTFISPDGKIQVSAWVYDGIISYFNFYM